MQDLHLILFEIKKQISSISFIIITAIFIIFALSQMGEIFHYPVTNSQDIIYLNEHGEDDYLYVRASQEELKTGTIKYLKKLVSQNQIEKKAAETFKNLISRMEQESLSFDQAYLILSEESPKLIYWLDSCKIQFGHKIGTVDEINRNMKINLKGKQYNTVFSEKYVTYIQLIATFLIFPLLILLFTRDSRYNMNEIIYVRPMSSTQYILCRYAGCLIPLFLILFILGLLMNYYIIYKFQAAGWQVDYHSFFIYYLTFLVPTILFLSSLIMFLILLLKKAIAVFPLYILYSIFNATQGAFTGQHSSNAIYKCVIRLDTAIPYNNFVFYNRILYLILSVLLIALSCGLYKYSRKKAGMVITL